MNDKYPGYTKIQNSIVYILK